MIRLLQSPCPVFPPYVKAAREPLSYAGVNSIGLRRRGFSNEQISAIQGVYRSIFQSHKNTSQALNYVETELPPTEERDEIVTFIRKATQGIIKGYSHITGVNVEKQAAK